MLVAAVAWSAVYALELFGAAHTSKLLWGDLKYVPVHLFGMAWVAFVLQYTGRGGWLRGPLLALLLTVPVAGLLVLANGATHDLFRYYPAGADVSAVTTVPASGPLFWVHYAYMMVVLWGGMVLLVTALARTSRLHRRQAVAAVVSAVPPFVAGLLYNLGGRPFSLVDLTPFMFVLTGVLLIWGLLRGNLLDLRSLARSRVFESLTEAVLTVDAAGRVADLNPSAERLLHQPGGRSLGRTTTELHAWWGPELTRLLAVTGSVATEPVVAELHPPQEHVPSPAQQSKWTSHHTAPPRSGHALSPAPCHEVRVTTLPDGRGRAGGHLVVVRDITAQRHAEANMRRTLARLQALDSEQEHLLGRLLSVHEAERLRIAGDLHDDTIQALAAAAMRVGLVRDGHGDDSDLAQVQEALTTGIHRLRALLFEMHPPKLGTDGFPVALHEQTKTIAAEAGLQGRTAVHLDAEPPAAVSATLLRIAQEALVNVRKHARAHEVTVTVRQDQGGFLLSVHDDGVGFDPRPSVSARPGHFGLAIMRERAEAAGGWLQTESAPGAGTTLTCWLPTGTTAPTDLPRSVTRTASP